MVLPIMALRSPSCLLWWSICFYAMSSTATAHLVVSSIVKMTKLAQFEQDLLTIARHRASQLPRQFVNFVSSVEAEYDRHDQLASHFIDFPINQYRLIRRFSYDWPLWREQLRTSENTQGSACAEFLTSYDALSIKHAKIDQIDPNFDIRVASFTISRLHLLYQNASRLVPSNEPTECPPFTEREMLELCASVGKDEDKKHSVYLAFHWLTVFIDRMKNFLPYSSPMFLVEYVMKHSDTYGRPDRLNETLEVETFVSLFRIMTESLEELNNYYDAFNGDPETRVCRYPEDRSEAGNHCFMFRTPRAPYAPFRYEILHREPYVAVVHNFMSRQKADHFISAATSHGSEANKVIAGYSLVDGSAVSKVKPKNRLSESTVFDHYHPLNTWFDLRVEHATLLLPHSQPMRYGIRDGEFNSVMHYGLSGHVIAHYDYVNNDTLFLTVGNRLATVLVYLSDVRSGGHTAFPTLDVSCKPRAGSALVWYNLNPWNGEPLPDTLHVGCPVNVGKKWLCNRWIRTHHKIQHSFPVNQ